MISYNAMLFLVRFKLKCFCHFVSFVIFFAFFYFFFGTEPIGLDRRFHQSLEIIGIFFNWVNFVMIALDGIHEADLKG